MTLLGCLIGGFAVWGVCYLIEHGGDERAFREAEDALREFEALDYDLD